MLLFSYVYAHVRLVLSIYDILNLIQNAHIEPLLYFSGQHLDS